MVDSDPHRSAEEALREVTAGQGDFGPSCTDARLRLLWSMVDTYAVDLLTVDVFDTLLWRTVPAPADAFVLMGERLRERGMLADAVTPIGFMRLRQAAERAARQRASAQRGTEEARLPEIYHCLTERLCFPVTSAQLMAVELEVEHAVCQLDRGLEALIRLVEERLGKRVVLVSDSYLSAEQVGFLLDRPDDKPLPFTRVYTSSDMGVNKAGGLLACVASALGVPIERIVHLGDNEESDVAPAREAGARAVHYAKLSPELAAVVGRESLLPGAAPIDPRRGDYGLTALRARTAHRVEAELLPRALQPYWSTGATVFGPAFAGFAEWVVTRARDLGVDRVYCLMREGEYLAELIRAAAPGLGSDLAAEVIWASRQVCAAAALLDADRDSLAAYLSRRNPPTVRQLVDQLGLDLAALPGLADIAETRLVSSELVDRVFAAIEGDPVVRARIVECAAVGRDRLARYWASVVPPDASRVVLVDVGWGGTIQRLLHDALVASGHDVALCGLYFMTNEGAVEQRLRGLQIEGYLADAGDPAPLLGPVMRSPEVIEQVCMADTGSLVGFTAELEPVTAPGRMPRQQVAQKAAVQHGILAFLREWQQGAHQAGLAGALAEPVARGLALRSIARFIARPTSEEALHFGAWSHDENYGSDAFEPVVRSEVYATMRYLSPARLAEMSMAEVYWPAAAAAVADQALAVEAALAAEGQLDAELLSPPAGTGPFEVFVDEGNGFRPGRKAVEVPRVTRGGLCFVRTRLAVGPVRAVRVDPGNQRGLLRLDWLIVRFGVHGSVAPIERRFTSLDDHPRISVHGARLLAGNLVEVTTGDPQIVWRLDPAAEADVLGRTYLVEVEVAFAWMQLGPAPLALCRPRGNAGAAIDQVNRQARRTVRALLRP